MTLIAETATDLPSALTIIAIVVAQVAQSLWLRWQNRDMKKKVDAAAASATQAAASASTQAKATTAKLESVHSLLNGTGIMGALGRIERNMKDHDNKDDDRFARVYRRLGMAEDAPEVP